MLLQYYQVHYFLAKEKSLGSRRQQWTTLILSNLPTVLIWTLFSLLPLSKIMCARTLLGTWEFHPGFALSFSGFLTNACLLEQNFSLKVSLVKNLALLWNFGGNVYACIIRFLRGNQLLGTNQHSQYCSWVVSYI